MAVKEKVAFAIVGASGLIGLRHFEHILAEPDATVTAIIDPAPAGLKLAEDYKILFYDSVDAFLAARQAGKVLAHAAILCTPTHTHVSLAIKLVKAGISTLVEKPLAVTSASGRQLLAAAQGEAKIITGHHRRFHPQTAAVKKLIESGMLGTLVAVSGIWAVYKPVAYFGLAWRHQAGSGGPILTNFVHEADLLGYLFGDIEEVYATEGARGRSYPVEETVALTFRFVNGAVGTFIVSDTADSPHCWEFATGENPILPKTGQTAYTILGTRGSICIPDLSRIRYHHDSQPLELKHWLTPMERDASLQDEINDVLPFTLQLRHFIAVVRGEIEPNCSAREGLKAVLVVEAIFKSLKTKQPIRIESLDL